MANGFLVSVGGVEWLGVFVPVNVRSQHKGFIRIQIVFMSHANMPNAAKVYEYVCICIGL